MRVKQQGIAQQLTPAWTSGCPSADDEWVRVMGEAVGTFDGQLDLQKVCESSSLVRDTVTGLQAGLHLAKPLPGFMPLQVGAWRFAACRRVFQLQVRALTRRS